MPVVVSVAQGGTGSNSSANALSAIGGAPLAAYAQANAAYAQANSAYGAANNAVLKAGDTMTGQLNISSGGLLVTGDVGIGSSAPSGRMEIRSTSSGTVPATLVLSNPVASSVGTGAELRFYVNDGGSDRYASVRSVQSTSGNYADLRFITSNSDTPTERMRIDAAGNLGVGTTSPLHNLHVGDGANTISMTGVSPVLAVKGALYNTGFVVRRDGYAEAGIRSSSTGEFGTWNNYDMLLVTNGTERMRVDTSGRVGINGTAQAFSRVEVAGNLAGTTAGIAHYVNVTVPNGMTVNAQGFRTNIGTAAAAFTLVDMHHFYAVQGALGAGSAVTNQFGFHAASTLTGATNNYGFYSNIASGTNRWNFYANGTAANYFAGDTGIGTTTIPARFTVQGAGTSTTVGGNIVGRFQTNGSGYDASIQLSDNVTNSAILSMLAGNISLISNGTNYFYINSSGLVGLNTTSPASQLQVNSTTEWGVRLRFAADTTTHRATFLTQRARGSLASPTAATSGTIVGGIEGAGYTGAAYTSGYDGGAAIQFIAESNWASANTPTFMSFWTNAVGVAGYSERMRITAAGNVGIGTTSPTSSPNTKLHIREDDSTDYRARAVVQATDQKLVIASHWQAGVDQYSFLQGYNDAENGTHKIILNPFGGNVGVGTTDFNAIYSGSSTINFTVGLSSSSADLLGLHCTVSGFGPYIDFCSVNSASNRYRYAAISLTPTTTTAGSETGALLFHTANAGGNIGERMRIRGSGGLAINNSLSVSHGLTVTRPGGGLERSFYVDNDGRTTARFDDNGMSQNLYLRNLGMTAANHGASIVAYINEDGTDAFGGAIRFGAETDYSVTRHSYLAFNISRSGNDTEGMRINSLGNILLGTTSGLGEGSRLDIITANAEADVTTWRYNNAAAGKYWRWLIDSNSRLHCYNQSGAGVYIDDGATSWSGSSDERLKTDLKPIEDSVDKVCQLRAVTGRFKTDVEGTSRSFLIAQDVQKVFPEAVSDQNPDELGLRYTDIIPLLVAGMQEQQALIQALTARVAELENK